MKTILLAGAVGFVFTDVALASVRRVTVTKETQPESGVDFSLRVEPVRGANGKPRADGYSRFILSLPANQKRLEHGVPRGNPGLRRSYVWRTELWILDDAGGRTVLSVPVALRQKPAGERTAEFSLSSELVERAIFALRCGKNAPLAESVYQIELKTYVEQRTAQRTERPSFGVYLVEGSDPVTARTPLEQLMLSRTAILTDADIAAYDWSSHGIELSEAAIARIRRIPKSAPSFSATRGKPFVVVVDEEPVYAGTFLSTMSSASHSAPAILVDTIPQAGPKGGTIRINRAYPRDDFAKGTDPRKDPRIRTCLEQLNKLRTKRETSSAPPPGTGRSVPVRVRGDVTPSAIRKGEPIPLEIEIHNGLATAITFTTYALKANDWNGETAGIELTDIHRDGSSNLYMSRPTARPPLKIAGMSRHVIEPGESLTVETDARKWKLRDDWLPGKYTIRVAVRPLMVDEVTSLSVGSDPIEFEIESHGENSG